MSGRSRLAAGYAVAVVLGTAAVAVPVVAGGAPAPVKPVTVHYVANGKPAGSGSALQRGGKLYVSLGAIKALTGVAVKYDPATATVSAGGASVAATGGGYLEDLPQQPYYVSSGALCWQDAVDGKPGTMHSTQNPEMAGYPCRLPLPNDPKVTGQVYSKELAVSVTADGHKTPDASNTVTMSFDLAGKYASMSTSVGEVDALNHSAMLVVFTGNGKQLKEVEVLPGALPVAVAVPLAGVHQLTITFTNMSGGAPGWNQLGTWQYAPDAVALISPKLK